MVLYYLLSRDLKKIEGYQFTLRAQKNSQDSVRITDEAAVPKSYCRIDARIDGVVWETVLSLSRTNLPRRWNRPFRRPGRTTTPSRRRWPRTRWCRERRCGGGRTCALRRIASTFYSDLSNPQQPAIPRPQLAAFSDREDDELEEGRSESLEAEAD